MLKSKREMSSKTTVTKFSIQPKTLKYYRSIRTMSQISKLMSKLTKTNAALIMMYESKSEGLNVQVAKVYNLKPLIVSLCHVNYSVKCRDVRCKEIRVGTRYFCLNTEYFWQRITSFDTYRVSKEKYLYRIETRTRCYILHKHKKRLPSFQIIFLFHCCP